MGSLRNARRLLIAACVLWAGHAQANLLTNGSFENTGSTFVGDSNLVDQLSSGSMAIPGWTTTNGVPTAWIENGNPYGISASNGSFLSGSDKLREFRNVRWSHSERDRSDGRCELRFNV
jgi:hypothetical protein